MLVVLIIALIELEGNFCIPIGFDRKMKLVIIVCEMSLTQFDMLKRMECSPDVHVLEILIGKLRKLAGVQVPQMHSFNY